MAPSRRRSSSQSTGPNPLSPRCRPKPDALKPTRRCGVCRTPVLVGVTHLHLSSYYSLFAVQVLRAGALMANGVTPVEPNPDFLEDVRRAAGGKVPGCCSSVPMFTLDLKGCPHPISCLENFGAAAGLLVLH